MTFMQQRAGVPKFKIGRCWFVIHGYLEEIVVETEAGSLPCIADHRRGINTTSLKWA
ncbi:hypothetical protein SP21_79 [Salmonella phage 21]|nr:hypothetical protein SP21_79 [Salmonella phage 21]